MPRSCRPFIVLACLICSAWPAHAREEIVVPPDQFLAAVVGQPIPKPSMLWLAGEAKQKVSAVLGHAPSQLRQRYWVAGGKTVWILEEIGKEEPITAGFVVDNGRLLQAQVLIYRESRGGEIRYPAFLRQYAGTGLLADGQLDRAIDGISGATLSVRAMGRMARLALVFDALSRSGGHE